MSWWALKSKGGWSWNFALDKGLALITSPYIPLAQAIRQGNKEISLLLFVNNHRIIPLKYWSTNSIKYTIGAYLHRKVACGWIRRHISSSNIQELQALKQLINHRISAQIHEYISRYLQLKNVTKCCWSAIYRRKQALRRD